MLPSCSSSTGRVGRSLQTRELPLAASKTTASRKGGSGEAEEEEWERVSVCGSASDASDLSHLNDLVEDWNIVGGAEDCAGAWDSLSELEVVSTFRPSTPGAPAQSLAAMLCAGPFARRAKLRDRRANPTLKPRCTPALVQHQSTGNAMLSAKASAPV